MNNKLMKMLTLSGILLISYGNSSCMGQMDTNTEASERSPRLNLGSGEVIQKAKPSQRGCNWKPRQRQAYSFLKDWGPTLAVLTCLGVHTYKNDRKFPAKALNFLRRTVTLKHEANLVIAPLTALVGLMGFDYYKGRVQTLKNYLF